VVVPVVVGGMHVRQFEGQIGVVGEVDVVD